MYAHLQRIDVAIGALMPRGGRVGTVGTANGSYPAHLHFEIRASDGVDIGAGYAMYPLDPARPDCDPGERACWKRHIMDDIGNRRRGEVFPVA